MAMVSLFSIDVITTARFYDVQVEIPDDVLSKGDDAVLKWCQDNRATVNAAPTGWTESIDIQSIQHVKRA